MSNPRDTLKTKDDECVLEKFFYEYIQVWFENKAISAVTYDKARKEIDLLTEMMKKGEKGKTEICMMNNPRDTSTTKGDEFMLERFFNEYIKVWFLNKAISPVTYDKARKELELLNGRKN